MSTRNITNQIHKMMNKLRGSQKFLMGVFALIIAVSFVTTSPSNVVSQKLLGSQIDKIKAQNEKLLNSLSSANIAYAQSDSEEPWDYTTNNPPDNNEGYDDGDTGTDTGTPICCDDYTTPGEGEYCDNANQCVGMCCLSGNQPTNPLPGYACDNSLCSEDPTCDEDPSVCPPRVVCDDVNAQNWEDSMETDADGRPRTGGGTCYFLHACCEPEAQNYSGDDTCADPKYMHDLVCLPKDPICCNGNYDNYVLPSERNRDTQTCDYDACDCNDSPPHTGASCGGDGSQCLIETGFSTIKSGVRISGSAEMDMIVDCDSQEEAELESYLAGMAADDATPETPLNTPITLDALSTYTVTSKDYCLNVAGDQAADNGYNRSSGGICCSNPSVPNDETGQCEQGASCGISANQTFETEPTSELCQNGAPSTVATNDYSYSWDCSLEGESAQCSANRTCNGESCAECTDLDCGQNDRCKNIIGSQDDTYLSQNNLAPDSYGVCWNSTTGACGSISQIPYVTTVPSSNLCISTASASPVSIDDNTGIYSWTCNSIQNGNAISPTCTVRQCQGEECQTDPSNNLIKSFKALPSIVSKAGDGCNLTWESNVDSSITDPEQGCRINGNTVADNNSSGTKVGPGSYSLMCYLGVSFQIKSVKCTVSPDYKEI